MGSLLLFCGGVRARAGPLAAGRDTVRRRSIVGIHRRRARARAAGCVGRGAAFFVALARSGARRLILTDRASADECSRVRSRISRAHDLTAWNASALGQRARPTG